MKVRIVFLTIFTVFLAVSIASAQGGRKTAFSGSEYFDPFGILGEPVGEFLNAGTVQCPGFEPTNDPLLPCPAGSRTHSRGTIWKSRFTSSTEGLSDGWFTITANSNLDANLTGPQWGTFSLAYDSGGTMEGTWQGVRYQDGDQWITTLHVNGRVTGGDFDGGNFIGTDQIVSFTPIPIAYLGTIEGSLVIPK